MNIMETKPEKYNDMYRQSASFRRHQKQRFWQILTPIILGGLIILAAAVLMVLTLTGAATGVNLSQYAAASTIWLVLPVMVFGIFMTVLLLGLIYGAAWLLNLLPQYTFLVQQYAALIEGKIKLWSQKATAPIITVKSISAVVSVFFKNLFAWAKK